MTVSIIAIVAANDVIGRGNQLPWHMPADLKRFKELTMGHHLIMGRKTFESVGKPLPGRVNVVVTRSVDFSPDGVAIARSVDEAISKAEAAGDDEIFIGGGAEIYAQTLHRADRMYITRLHGEPEGDTFFPEFDDVNEWKLVDAEHFEADERNTYPYSFLTYERAPGFTQPE
ncbi:MAG TPA: dihydrofolate reductase [Thermoanaerobaculia bacterium]|nr:dihydrofolate reductase [Thermoanaerobaculia bacterium]